MNFVTSLHSYYRRVQPNQHKPVFTRSIGAPSKGRTRYVFGLVEWKDGKAGEDPTDLGAFPRATQKATSPAGAKQPAASSGAPESASHRVEVRVLLDPNSWLSKALFTLVAAELAPDTSAALLWLVEQGAAESGCRVEPMRYPIAAWLYVGMPWEAPSAVVGGSHSPYSARDRRGLH
jgi:hypothetical protein